ncbi:MAG: hypothetical protein Q9226_003895, partial [Calogaya cf. arnoldii]
MSYEVGVSTSFSGSASMTFGIMASLPNTAAVVADVRHPSLSSATGFDGSAFDPNFDLRSLSASVKVAAFAQPKLSFGVDVTRVGHMEIAVVVKSPVISATLTGGYSKFLPSSLAVYLSFLLSFTLPLQYPEQDILTSTDQTGLCSSEPGASKTGVKLSSEVALEVNLELNAQL